MQITDASRAARTVIDDFDLADYDAEYDYYQALVGDEWFGAVCYLYQEIDVYADGANATAADKEARDALERSINEHARRVRVQLKSEIDA